MQCLKSGDLLSSTFYDVYRLVFCNKKGNISTLMESLFSLLHGDIYAMTPIAGITGMSIAFVILRSVRAQKNEGAVENSNDLMFYQNEEGKLDDPTKGNYNNGQVIIDPNKLASASCVELSGQGLIESNHYEESKQGQNRVLKDENKSYRKKRIYEYEEEEELDQTDEAEDMFDIG